MISEDKIREYLCEKVKSADIKIFDEIASTNTFLKENCYSENEWYTVIASSQTGGKGRLGRSFYSPQNTGVYFSVLLKPELEIEKAVLITTAAAVAVVRSLDVLGCKDSQIKWVNDIFVKNKKVCGILSESVVNAESKKLDFAVLGVGINLFAPVSGFPEELKNIAGFVFSEEKPYIKEKFVAEFLNEFYKLYSNLKDVSFMDEYRKRCMCLGKNVSVISQNETRNGKVISIDENARLLVEFGDGNSELINSGEISIKI